MEDKIKDQTKAETISASSYYSHTNSTSRSSSENKYSVLNSINGNYLTSGLTGNSSTETNKTVGDFRNFINSVSQATSFLFVYVGKYKKWVVGGAMTGKILFELCFPNLSNQINPYSKILEFLSIYTSLEE